MSITTFSVGRAVRDGPVGVRDVGEVWRVPSSGGRSVPSSTGAAAARRIAPWCSRLRPVGIGSSVQTPEWPPGTTGVPAQGCPSPARADRVAGAGAHRLEGGVQGRAAHGVEDDVESGAAGVLGDVPVHGHRGVVDRYGLRAAHERRPGASRRSRTPACRGPWRSGPRRCPRRRRLRAPEPARTRVRSTGPSHAVITASGSAAASRIGSVAGLGAGPRASMAANCASVPCRSPTPPVRPYTSSPAAKPSTAGPVSITRPARSMPGTAGGRTRACAAVPALIFVFSGFTALAWTRTSTSTCPSPGPGTVDLPQLEGTAERGHHSCALRGTRPHASFAAAECRHRSDREVRLIEGGQRLPGGEGDGLVCLVW